MSFSPAICAFQAYKAPRHWPARPGRPPARADVRPASDHPVLFMGGFLLAVSLAVIGLWQALGLLLPH